MKFVRFLVEMLLLGLAVLAFQYSGWWALLFIPLILAMGVYLELEYFEPRAKGQLTFYHLRSREKQIEEFWRTEREAENKLFHRDN